jgi:hypothetical protein
MKRTVTAAVAGVALTGMIGIGVAAAATGSGPGSLISDALAGLVADRTLTQEQADAVAKALGDAHEEARAERDQRRAERQAEVDALLQDTLGMTREQLHEQLAAGKTLKDIAGENADELAAGALKLAEEELDEAVSDGRLTQEQADEALARAKERTDAWLAGDETQMGRGFALGFLLGRGMGGGPDGMGGADGMRGPGGMGRHGGRGMGPGWGGGEAPTDSGTSSSGTTSTTVWRT